MADHDLREALNDCLDRMAAGQSIDDCLSRYPQYAAKLRPMLEVGSLVERAQVSTVEVAAANARVRARVNAHLRARPEHHSYIRPMTLVASLLIAFAVLFGAAENSLPGDPLYGVKRFTENARTSLIGQQFAARRLDEIRALEALKRPADVQFSGTVEQIEGTSWRVEGLEMQVAAGTTGAALVVVSDAIQVSAQTSAQGDLTASAITLLNQTVMPLVSTATPTPTPTSPTPSPTGCAPTKPEGWVSYVVQPNDTVAELAVMTGVSTEQLVAVNCLPETLMILVGQSMFLPILPPSTPTSSPPTLTFTPEAPFQPTDSPPEQLTAEPTATATGHGSGDGSGSDD